MKVIFLDFDGVITSKNGYSLDPEKMELVKRICDETDAYIVVSSSWRRFTLEDTIKSITEVCDSLPVPFLMPERIIGVTPRMYAFKYVNPKKHFIVPRGYEIERYLEEHKDIEKYVIIDDEDDMLLCQKPFFIKINSKSGISEKDVEKAIKLLS